MTAAWAIQAGSAAGQVCAANAHVVDNGCAGCSTSIQYTCESIDDVCEGCQYQVTATITCFSGGQIWTGSAELECGGKYERRYGGCGAGPAWGGFTCDCGDCPQ